MNKGYLIAHVTVSDPAAYSAYARAAGEAMQDFNPKIVAWSGQYENLEGETHERHVVFEFASFDEAKRFMRVQNTRPRNYYVRARRAEPLF